MDALTIISEGSIKAEKPQFNVGDTVRVDVRIKEGERERIQAFEGTNINADGIADVELGLLSLDAAFRNNLQCVHFEFLHLFLDVHTRRTAVRGPPV